MSKSNNHHESTAAAGASGAGGPLAEALLVRHEAPGQRHCAAGHQPRQRGALGLEEVLTTVAEVAESCRELQNIFFLCQVVAKAEKVLEKVELKDLEFFRTKQVPWFP